MSTQLGFIHKLVSKYNKELPMDGGFAGGFLVHSHKHKATKLIIAWYQIKLPCPDVLYTGFMQNVMMQQQLRGDGRRA
jgi:hypothetical protein